MATTTTTIQAKASLANPTYLTVTSFRSSAIIDLVEYNNAKLQEYIDRAQLMVDDWLGGNIGYSSYRDEHIRGMYDYPKNGIAIQLPRRPIDRITKIVLTFCASTTLTWDTATKIANWRINNDIGYIEYFGLTLSDYVLNICLRDPMASNIIPMAEVTYYAGYRSIPDNITKAMVILTEQLIRVSEGSDTEISSVSIGNYRETNRRSKGIKSVGVIGGTDQVERLLRPYRQPSQTMFVGGPYG